MRQSAAGLLDDLRRGRVVVRAPVAVVVVLVRVEIAIGILRVQPPRLADRAVGAFERIGQDQLGAERAQNQLALGARVLRHAQRALCSRAPRRPSRRRCRCCPTSRRESSCPASACRSASPSRIIRAAARSLTEPPGFCHSAFAYSSTPGVSRSNWCRRTSGVRPIMSRTEESGARSRTEEVSSEDICEYPTELVLILSTSANPVKLAAQSVTFDTIRPTRNRRRASAAGSSATGRRFRCPSRHRHSDRCGSARRPRRRASIAGRRRRDGRSASCCGSGAVHHIGVISRTRSDRLGPLVASGPFALVRNPLYLGNIALWVGFALTARLRLAGAGHRRAARRSSTTRSCGGRRRLLESRLGDALSRLRRARAALGPDV